MFSKLFGSKPKTVGAQPLSAPAEIDNSSLTLDSSTATSTDPVNPTPAFEDVDFEINADIGGAKGWPTDASVVFYHRAQGLICIGTEGGAVYACGDGFQFLRPWLTADANEVVSIVAPSRDTILVAFGDNSLAVLELPSLTVVDLLEGSWLPPNVGNITFAHVDEPGERNFVFVGTTKGYVFILEVRNSIRICEVVLTPTDFGLTQPMAVAEIQLCPKDEKYIAVAFSGSSKEIGAVVIFNFVKFKVKVNSPTAAVTSLVWSHQGDVLYAGTRGGLLHCVNLEKHTCVEVWNAIVESEDEDVHPTIKRLVWHAPQKPNDPPALFILLGVTEDSSPDSLRSSLVALAPIGSHGELKPVFSLPTMPQEDIVGFRLVPTIDKLGVSLGGKRKPLPALLILTQRRDEDGEESANEEEDGTDDGNKPRPIRQLKIVRCPACGVQDWVLELASVEAPRRAVEVLPANAEVTCLVAFLPATQTTSLSSFLVQSANSTGYLTENAFDAPKLARHLSGASTTSASSGGGGLSRSETINEDDEEEDDDEDEPAPRSPISTRVVSSRRTSARDFLAINVSVCGKESEAVGSGLDVDPPTWELVLAEAGGDDAESCKQKVQDVVLLGHADGMVIAWGVFLPEPEREKGRGNKYVPLKILRCGSTEVSALAYDDNSGVLVAGDISGGLVCWELVDELKDDGAVGRQQRAKKRAVSLNSLTVVAARSTSASNVATPPDDTMTATTITSNASEASAKGVQEEEEEAKEEEECEGHFQPNNMREAFRGNVAIGISSLLIVSTATTIVVGTDNGSVFMTSSFSLNDLNRVELGRVGGARGPVVGLSYAPFYFGNASVPAVFIVFTSGHIAVVHLRTQSLLAYTVGPPIPDDEDDDEDENVKHNPAPVRPPHVAISCVVDAAYTVVSRPDPNALDISMLMVNCSAASASVAAGANGPTSAVPAEPEVPTPARRSYRFFSTGPETPPPPTGPASTLTPPRKDSNASTVFAFARPNSAKAALASTAITIPAGEPRFFLAAIGLSIITYDLAKFAIVNQPGGNTFSSVSFDATTTQKISSFPLIGGSIVTFVEEAARAWAVPLPCFSFLDSSGSVIIMSVHTRRPIAHADLLEGVLVGPVQLQSGVMLSSGNCYLLENETMLFSSSISSKTHLLSNPLPARVSNVACPPPSDLQLLTGREQVVAATKLAVKKRRQSMITLTTGPTDLDKIFSKTRTQAQKDRLLSGAATDEEESKAKSAARGAVAVKSELNELADVLNQRGERLSRLAQRMDQFKDNSQEYNKATAEHKQRLKAKADAWGLGMF